MLKRHDVVTGYGMDPGELEVVERPASHEIHAAQRHDPDLDVRQFRDGRYVLELLIHCRRVPESSVQDRLVDHGCQAERGYTCEYCLPQAARFYPAIDFSGRKGEHSHPPLEQGSGIAFNLEQARDDLRFPDPYRLRLGLVLGDHDMVFGEPSAQGLSCPGLARLLGEPDQIFAMSTRDAVQVRLSRSAGLRPVRPSSIRLSFELDAQPRRVTASSPVAPVMRT
jgi:hypothetical protein